MRYKPTLSPAIEVAGKKKTASKGPADKAPADKSDSTRPRYTNTPTPEERINRLEARLRADTDTAGLATLERNRHKLLVEMRGGMTHCLSYYDLDPDLHAVHSTGDVVRQLEGLRDLEQEEFWAIHLDARHRILTRNLMHRGSVDVVPVYLRDTFRDAVRLNTAALIVAHNHPSGEPSPSLQDDALTVRVQHMGNHLGIPLLDHVVISRYGHFSYAEADKLGPDSSSGFQMFARDQAEARDEAPPAPASLWLGKHKGPVTVPLARWTDYPYFIDSLAQFAALPDLVTVTWGAYQDFTRHGFDDAGDWDFVHAVAGRMREGEDIPPLIREHGEPSDGRHRAFSAKRLRIRRAPIVDLERPAATGGA